MAEHAFVAVAFGQTYVLYTNPPVMGDIDSVSGVHLVQFREQTIRD